MEMTFEVSENNGGNNFPIKTSRSWPIVILKSSQTPLVFAILILISRETGEESHVPDYRAYFARLSTLRTCRNR